MPSSLACAGGSPRIGRQRRELPGRGAPLAGIDRKANRRQLPTAWRFLLHDWFGGSGVSFPGEGPRSTYRFGGSGVSAAGVKQKGEAKTARIPIKVVAAEPLRKPPWIRVRLGNNERFHAVKRALRANGLHTVCEEASCPNIGECFGKGTATFMILGDLCTRRCPFCDVAHGRPLPPDPAEPERLAH